MDKPVKKFSFLKSRKIFERLDLYPFIIIHSVAMIVYTNQNTNKLLKGIVFGAICLLQGITFFAKFWDENIMAKICYKPAKSINEATDIKVDVVSQKFKMNNRTSISKLKKLILKSKSFNEIPEEIIKKYEEILQKFTQTNIL